MFSLFLCLHACYSPFLVGVMIGVIMKRKRKLRKRKLNVIRARGEKD